jgi:hypothetical protein
MPNVASSNGVLNDVFTNLHRIENPNHPPPMSSFNTLAPMQSQLAARNEFAQLKEVSNMMRKTRR